MRKDKGGRKGRTSGGEDRKDMGGEERFKNVFLLGVEEASGWRSNQTSEVKRSLRTWVPASVNVAFAGESQVTVCGVTVCPFSRHEGNQRPKGL